MTGGPVVFVVDDDPSVRSSLTFLISTVGLRVESFASAESKGAAAALPLIITDTQSIRDLLAHTFQSLSLMRMPRWASARFLPR